MADKSVRYTPEFKRQMVDLVRSGRSPASLANEYELDLLRQRSLEARRAMARRGELLITAPVGFRKGEDQRFEKNPDRRVQEAIRLVFDHE